MHLVEYYECVWLLVKFITVSTVFHTVVTATWQSIGNGQSSTPHRIKTT